MAGFSNLLSPRYYTALDPYYYEVDNRPLVDLAKRDDSLNQGMQAIDLAQKVATAAAGFIARGMTSPNNVVGKLSYPGGLRLSIDRAFLTQERQISSTDSRLYPLLSLAEDISTFTLTAPAVGFFRTYLITANSVSQTNSLPFVDTTNPDLSKSSVVGQIAWVMKQYPTDQTDFSTLQFPNEDPGFVPAIKVVIAGGSQQITQNNLTFVNFSLEGTATFGGPIGQQGPQYSYDHDQKVLTSSANTVTNVKVNCLYAFVFVDGQIAFNVNRQSASTVVFDEVLPAGTVVDFITTAGGTAIAAQGGQNAQLFVAGPSGQSIFTGVTVLSEGALVFVNGGYRHSSTYSFNAATGTLTFNTPIPAGQQVAVITLTGFPAAQATIPGGFYRQVLAKLSNDINDFGWVDPIFTFPGGTVGQVLTKTSDIENDFNWATPSALHGQVRLTTSGNTLILTPYNGNALIVNGITRTLPLSGISINPAAQDPGIYAVYAYASGTSLLLELSRYPDTSYVLASNGVFVKEGNPTRTLVGFINIETQGVVEMTSQKRFVRSWFNDPLGVLNTQYQDRLPMNAFSLTQYRYVEGQILSYLSLPNDNVVVRADYTIEAAGGETAGVALANNKSLGQIPTTALDVRHVHGLSPATISILSGGLANHYNSSDVAVRQVALYANENSTLNAVFLSARLQASISR